MHAIIIDRSDPITPQQAQRIRQIVQSVKNGASFGYRFDVYTFEGDTKSSLQPILRICSPGRPEEANELIENPDLIKRRYEQKFSNLLDRTLDELLRESTRDNSPIIESLRAAAITSFGPFERGQIPLRLTMISDMIQHTPLYSQFRAEANFSQLFQAPAWSSLRPNLKGAETDILYLLRPTATRAGKPIQTRGHQSFWEQLISAANGQLNKIEPI